ncbi:tyrosine-type recombinase/integrase [Leucobacter musarum]|uniref:tyrosine-type recombinase/integrase n=1 Tax=Leucobacter musarum TaxID=1930747 RepID=UPI0006A7E98F|nr:tyrosine-type recombinase/integrase [Leucobacter musarum]
MAEKKRKQREKFGRVRKRSNGRYTAGYVGPDGELHWAPATFAAITEARHWLAERQAEIAKETWQPPAARAAQAEQAAAEAARREVTLGEYAAKWIETRTNSRGEPLRPRTVENYEGYLRPAGVATKKDTPGKGGPLADMVGRKLGEITPEMVREWRAAQFETGRISQTSRAYDLMKSVLKTAVDDGIIEKNPCQIRGGSTASTGKKVEPPTDAELDVILSSIDKRYKALVVLACGAGLRWGENTELRAKDVVVERDEAGEVDCVRISVSRQVVLTKKNGRDVGEVKTLAGVRNVVVYGDDARIIAAQARGKIGNALLTTNHDGSGWLPQTSFWRHWHKAVVAAGRPDLPFHGLRHFAGTRYAQTGATLKETMDRLGHSSVKAAMRYQASGNRDDELARRMAQQRAS